jgi:hypothetical protein
LPTSFNLWTGAADSSEVWFLCFQPSSVLDPRLSVLDMAGADRGGQLVERVALHGVLILSCPYFGFAGADQVARLIEQVALSHQ